MQPCCGKYIELDWTNTWDCVEYKKKNSKYTQYFVL